MGPLALSALIGLAAKILPSAVGRITGSQAAKSAADEVAEIVRGVSGDPSVENGAQAILASPELQVQMFEALKAWESVKEREETARLKIVNATIRAEARSDDPIVRHWRPFWGYAAGTAFFLQVALTLGLAGWALVTGQDGVGSIIAALSDLAGAMFPLWGVALAVLGVQSWKRSQDKAVEAKRPPLLAQALQAMGVGQDDDVRTTDMDAKMFE